MGSGPHIKFQAPAVQGLWGRQVRSSAQQAGSARRSLEHQWDRTCPASLPVPGEAQTYRSEERPPLGMQEAVPLPAGRSTGGCKGPRAARMSGGLGGQSWECHCEPGKKGQIPSREIVWGLDTNCCCHTVLVQKVSYGSGVLLQVYHVLFEKPGYVEKQYFLSSFLCANRA